MLRHATHCRQVRLVKNKVGHCKVCGREVTYATKPKDYCAEHDPRRNGYWDPRLVPAAKVMQLELVLTPPGFCSRCGCIRLSVANVNGICDGCQEDTL